MKFRDYLAILSLQIVIIVLLVSLGIIFLPPDIIVPRTDFILNASITCATTFSGFTLAVVSILLSFSRSALLDYLREKGGIQELIFRYTFSLVLGLIYIMFCGVCGGILPEDTVIPKAFLISWAVLLLLYLYNLNLI